MSQDIKQQILRFVAALKSDKPKITWDEIAKRAHAKFPKAEGLTGNAIRKRYYVWLRKLEDSKLSNNENQGAKITMSQKSKEQLPQELIAYIEDYVEEYVRPIIERISKEVAEKVIEEKLSYLPKVPSTTSEGYLPAPPMPDTVPGTRRHTVQRGKLAGTVDAALLELFEKERKERGFSVSRMLDVVIWNYFSLGKPSRPRLSFETEDNYATSDT